MTRREAILAMGAALPARGLRAWETARSRMGIADFSYALRRRADRANGKGSGFNDPFVFLEHAAKIGAGGIQTGLGAMEKDAASRLRARAEASGLYVQASIGFPRNRADVERFDAQVRTAKAVGGTVIRSIHLSGRRYETFRSLEQW